MFRLDVMHEAVADAEVGSGVAAQSALVQVAIGEIEGALWSVNDRIRELAPTWDGLHALVCECADMHCLRTLSIPASAFDELRAAPRRFAVAPGHEEAESETVLLCADDYFIISRPRVPAGDPVMRP
jgi:hypothetical protein